MTTFAQCLYHFKSSSEE